MVLKALKTKTLRQGGGALFPGYSTSVTNIKEIKSSKRLNF